MWEGEIQHTSLTSQELKTRPHMIVDGAEVEILLNKSNDKICFAHALSFITVTACDGDDRSSWSVWNVRHTRKGRRALTGKGHSKGSDGPRTTENAASCGDGSPWNEQERMGEGLNAPQVTGGAGLCNVKLPDIRATQRSRQPHEPSVSHEKVDFLDTLPLFLHPFFAITDAPAASIVRCIDGLSDFSVWEFGVFHRMNRQPQLAVELG